MVSADRIFCVRTVSAAIRTISRKSPLRIAFIHLAPSASIGSSAAALAQAVEYPIARCVRHTHLSALWGVTIRAEHADADSEPYALLGLGGNSGPIILLIRARFAAIDRTWCATR